MSAERPRPRDRLHSLRPRQRDIPFDEQAALLARPGPLPVDLRIALAVTHALSGELAEMTERHRAEHEAEPYRVDLFDALGQRLGITERTLRRIHGGLRWITVPEIALMLADPDLGSRLTARLRALDVDLLSTRPTLATNGELPAEPGTVEDMEDDYTALEDEARERVRTLASRQSVAAANHLPASQTDWLAVERTMTHEWTPTPRTATVPDQLRPLGLSLAGIVRDVLAEQDEPASVGTILTGVMAHVSAVQTEHGLPRLMATRHQITDALKYLRARGEVVSDQGRHRLTEGTTHKR